jgi:CzcA family heavy metal efflux pump
MLNRVISAALHNRLLVIVGAVLVLVYGVYTAVNLPVDVLPDLNKPQVTVFLEAEGLAPEEVEQLITLPVERTLIGMPGVEAVRSNSTIGLGMVFVTFAYGTDILKDRQLVAEKLQTAQEQLPNGVVPTMGPISSIMGQIMLVGVSSDTTSKADLRTLADFTIRPRLLSIKGISQVIPIGGDVQQYQVLIDPQKMYATGITVDQLERALANSNANTTGNFYERRGQEILIRNIGRIRSLSEIQNIVVSYRDGTPVFVRNVADVQFGAKQKRGDGSVNGKPAVILAVEKQPGANTLDLTEDVEAAVGGLQKTMPADVRINPAVFQQSHFIRNSIANVQHALRDGAILVVIVLFVFLFNVRTTVISLTAIPLSLALTAIIFSIFGLSVNTMTLGGLAIAIGELVDDSIVDVENVFRRLKENRHSPNPKHPLAVIYGASSEVRNSIVYATIIVVLVFLPLFALSGVEGRIFEPLGIAYITSILASLLVSLTVTPVMCYYLLPNAKIMRDEKDSAVVRWLKKQDTRLLNRSLDNPRSVLGGVGVLFAGALALALTFGSEFLPPFNEGSLTVNMYATPGTSLQESNRLGTLAEKQLLKIPEVKFTARRTGRAELDEHAEGVHSSEIEVELDYDKSERSQEEVLADVRDNLSPLKGVTVVVGQPISHRLEHLLSGVRAQVAILLYGDDLNALRTYADQLRNTLQSVEGVTDLSVEQQVLIPQLNVRIDDARVAQYGLEKGAVVEELQALLQGVTVTQVVDGAKRFDLVVKLPDDARADNDHIGNTLISLPSGGTIPVREIATIEETPGPNTISHENGQRKITVSFNTAGRNLSDVVQDAKAAIDQNVHLPQGYFVEYGGQYETQRRASRLLWILALVAAVGIYLVLYSHFKSHLIVLQIMLNLPMAMIGGVVAVWLTGSVFSIATAVGFITLTGIASRNGIMMISHYLYLMEHEGEKFGRAMIVRGSLERLVPVMMTALVAALALIPLLLDKNAAGKEILYPVAAVIVGGLVSSTLLDMLVTPVVFYLIGEKAVNSMSH